LLLWYIYQPVVLVGRRWACSARNRRPAILLPWVRPKAMPIPKAVRVARGSRTKGGRESRDSCQSLSYCSRFVIGEERPMKALEGRGEVSSLSAMADIFRVTAFGGGAVSWVIGPSGRCPGVGSSCDYSLQERQFHVWQAQGTPQQQDRAGQAPHVGWALEAAISKGSNVVTGPPGMRQLHSHPDIFDLHTQPGQSNQSRPSSSSAGEV